MGIEFIRNASGKPYAKRWARGIDRIKTPTLMDVSISEESRTLTAKLTAKGAAYQGATVLIQSKGPDLVVFDGLRQVASITNAPPSVRAAVDARQAWLRPSSSASGSSDDCGDQTQMTRRAPQEPTRDFKPSHRLRDDAALYAPSLGCGGCPDFKTCGGLHTDAGVFDCNDFCSCEDRAACDSVCRNKPDQFFERYLEIGGFELESTPGVRALATPELPSVIPLIGHKYSRKSVLNEPVIAVPLYELFHMRSGQPHVRTRAELAERFRIPETATVVVSGVDRDIKLEAWWAFADRELIMSTLCDLGIALVTVPNFSLFLNVPRPDNLHSMKRIALGWAELMAAGIPAALHLNARTDQDYERWMRFVQQRPEVEIVAFEFRTGAGVPSRIDWHVDRLCRIADAAGRPITLVVRGGAQVLYRLKRHFGQVILIETDAFARTLKRRRAEFNEAGRLRWPRISTPKGAPIDDLLAHNIATKRTALLLSDFAPTAPSERSARNARRSAQHADGQAGQGSFLAELDATFEARAVPTDLERVIVAAET